MISEYFILLRRRFLCGRGIYAWTRAEIQECTLKIPKRRRGEKSKGDRIYFSRLGNDNKCIFRFFFCCLIGLFFQSLLGVRPWSPKASKRTFGERGLLKQDCLPNGCLSCFPTNNVKALMKGRPVSVAKCSKCSCAVWYEAEWLTYVDLLLHARLLSHGL